MQQLQGVFAPVPSPFTDDASALSEVRLARWLQRQSPKVDGFVVGGEAGEFGALSFAERKHLLELAMRSVPPGKPVVMHVSTLSTAAGIDLCHHASELGAKAGVIMPPYFGKLTDSEILRHFQLTQQHGRLPLIVVDPRGRLGSELRDGIRQAAWMAVAEPLRGAHATTDDFRAGEVACSALSLLDGSDVVARLLNKYGAARVLKAESELLGFDLGPVRGPLSAMPADAYAELGRSLTQSAA